MRGSCVGASFRIKLTNVTIPRSVKLPSATLERSRYTDRQSLGGFIAWRMIYRHNTPLRTTSYYAAGRSPRSGVYDNLRNPADAAAPPFPHSFGIPGGIFHQTHRRESEARPVNSSGVCVYEPGNIGKRLNPWGPSTWSDRPPTRRAYMSRRRCTRIYRGEGLMVPLVHISGKPLEFVCQTADVLLYLVLGATGKFELQPGPDFWRRARTAILGPELRYAIVQSREKSLDTIHTFLRPFTRSNPFVSFSFPYRRSLRFPPRRRDISFSRWLLPELTVFLATKLSSCCRTSIAILN